MLAPLILAEITRDIVRAVSPLALAPLAPTIWRAKQAVEKQRNFLGRHIHDTDVRTNALRRDRFHGIHEILWL